MASSSKSTSNQHIRSISLPSSSCSLIHRIQQKLNNLKNHKQLAQNRLSGLEELYKYMDEFLNLSSTQQVLSQNQKEKWVDELLDGSMKLLDICGKTIDLVSQMKEQLGDLHSCLRRRKGDSSIESNMSKFLSYRKKMKKDAKRTILALKQIKNEIEVFQILDFDHHLLAVIRLIRDVSSTSVSIFQSLLIFFSMLVSKSNQMKWSLVLNLRRKNRVVCEGHFQHVNELEGLDVALSTLRKYGSSKTEDMQIAQKKLESLEGHVEEIESGLECIFRRLIRTRTSLLNIFSH